MPCRLVYIPVCESTMIEARRLATQTDEGIVAVWTSRQTGGKGRQGRNWQGSAKNLMATLVIKSASLPSNIIHLPYIVDLAICDVLEVYVTGHQLQIKWPNDILLDVKKLGGILIENDPSTQASLIGIGLNIGCTPEIPVADRKAGQGKNVIFSLKPVSLVDIVQTPPDLESLLAELCNCMQHKTSIWKTRGFAGQLHADYHEKLWKRGEIVKVAMDAEKNCVIQGENLGLSEDGGLCLMTDKGERTIYTGDVS